MVYQGNSTKFIQLSSLETKWNKEVACHLLDTLTTFGTSCILLSDNIWEFGNKIIEDVCGIWNKFKIVPKNPRHIKTQKSVERAN